MSATLVVFLQKESTTAEGMKISQILKRFTVPHLVWCLAFQSRKAHGASEDEAEEDRSKREEEASSWPTATRARQR